MRMRDWMGLMLAAGVLAPTRPALAQPEVVTLVGDLQTEIGCGSDWDPTCTASRLVFDGTGGIWRGTFALAEGSYLYGAALDNSLDDAWGLNGQPLAGNEIPLVLAAPATTKFYYEPSLHWMTDTRRSRIVTAPGSYQSEIGCPADWQPDCLRAWLLDVDGDAVFERSFPGLPAGEYAFKVAVGESWNENYGTGGVANGANIAFSIVHADDVAILRFVGATNTPTVTIIRDNLFRSGFE